jgi:phospholipase/lecithinase/hemolysin
MRAAVLDYNTKLYAMVRKVNHDLGYTTVFWFDAYSLMSDVIEDPSQYSENSGYKDTTSFCSAYKNGTPEVDTKYDECTYAADEYLWINNLYPTQPFHQLLARQIGSLLSSGAPL